jgi:hypothetical protein
MTIAKADFDEPSRSFVEMPEGCVVMIDDEHEMVSSGFANITPWRAPRDIPDEELGGLIEAMAEQLPKIIHIDKQKISLYT